MDDEIGRRLTTKPRTEKKLGIDYDTVVKWDHWNTYAEVVSELAKHFEFTQKAYVPLGIPSVHLSAIICMEGRVRR